jgi:hypothetical protein
MKEKLATRVMQQLTKPISLRQVLEDGEATVTSAIITVCLLVLAIVLYGTIILEGP